MVARLILFVLLYLLAIGAPVATIGYVVHKALGPSRKRRQAKRLAERHAKLLTAHMREDDDQQCFHCSQHCTEEDCYEKGKGWYHEKCLRELLNS